MLPIHSHHCQAVPPERLELNAAEKRLLAAEEAARGCRLQEMRKLPLYDMCFACGEANPIGLHLHFSCCPERTGAWPFSRPVRNTKATTAACTAA